MPAMPSGVTAVVPDRGHGPLLPYVEGADEDTASRFG